MKQLLKKALQKIKGISLKKPGGGQDSAKKAPATNPAGDASAGDSRAGDSRAGDSRAGDAGAGDSRAADASAARAKSAGDKGGNPPVKKNLAKKASAKKAGAQKKIAEGLAFLRKTLKHPSALLFSSLFFLILLDQTLKSFFLLFNFKTGSFLGFSLELFANKDFVLSWKPAAGALFNNLVLTPVFVWVIFLYFLSVHYIPLKMKAVRWGWTAVAAGALANMSDKLRLTYVLDVFAFRPSDSFALHFNLADIILTVGALSLIAAAIAALAGFLARGKPERRKKLLSLKKEQTEFVLAVIWVSFCFSLLFLIATHQFFTQYITLSLSARPSFADFAFKYFAVATVSFLIPVWAAFFYISHKIYGPIYAFERYVRALIRKEAPPDLRLRQGDQLKRLEALAKEIKDGMDNPASSRAASAEAAKDSTKKENPQTPSKNPQRTKDGEE